jgi:hypothetical protein
MLENNMLRRIFRKRTVCGKLENSMWKIGKLKGKPHNLCCSTYGKVIKTRMVSCAKHSSYEEDDKMCIKL